MAMATQKQPTILARRQKFKKEPKKARKDKLWRGMNAFLLYIFQWGRDFMNNHYPQVVLSPR